MCEDTKKLEVLANTFIKQELKVIDNKLTKDDKISLVNSLATLNVLGDYLKRSLVMS